MQAALLPPPFFTSKRPLPIPDVGTKENILNPAYCRKIHERLWWSTMLLCTANPGLNFFNCGTARKTQVKFELSKKANTDFHSPDHSTVQRVMWILLEENILSLTDGTAQTILRMNLWKATKHYFQLHLYYNYTAVVAKLFWCIFISLSNMTRQHWDPAGFGSSSYSSYDA